MLILLLLADKIVLHTFLAHSQDISLIPGFRLVVGWQWGLVWNYESPPSDNTFSGSCKDVQHINGDMHHRDVKSASVHGGRFLPSQLAETSPGTGALKWEHRPFHLPPFSLSAPLLVRVLGKK